jgi:hypothetical protein
MPDDMHKLYTHVRVPCNLRIRNGGDGVTGRWGEVGGGGGGGGVGRLNLRTLHAHCIIHVLC